MQLKSIVAFAAAVGSAVAQRPANMSVCDYYTTALLTNNTASNQFSLLKLIVNTAVIGNYTQPNVGIKVAGILAPGTYNGTDVNLLPYFNGELASSNRGGDAGVSVNFLDGGGAAPLMQSMAADDVTSNQYFLLNHLYEFFGALLGCSQYGMGMFTAYDGQASMYEVHKFMDLNPMQLGYFIEQVALSGASFGVAAADLMAVGLALNSLFGYRCAPEVTVIPAQGDQLQAICIDGSCPVAPANATCSAYDATVLVPVNTTSNMTMTAPGSSGTATGMASGGMASSTAGATATSGSGSGSGGSASGTSTATGASSSKTGGAAAVGFSFAAVAVAAFAVLLL